MKRILVLGAGLSTPSLIKYLLEHAVEYDWQVTVGDIEVDRAREKVKDHECGHAISFNVNNENDVKHHISNSDIVISLLPARFHQIIAEVCVKLKKNMVSASYVTPDMKALDGAAKDAGIILFNELGVDPGIDHMSAMKIIDQIKDEGGKLTGFWSSTGGLVAPEYDNNPWNYKFTWNPRNVVLAGQGVSKFIRNGKYKYIPYHELFNRLIKIPILDMGNFEIYPNRDSLKYRETYGLQSIQTMYRGTIRRPGFCEAWNVFVQLGATDDTYTLENSENMTYREFINTFLFYELNMPVESKLAVYMGIREDSEVMDKIKWLGVFEDNKIGLKNATPAQILQQLLEEKWTLGSDDKDMIVMRHLFEYTDKNNDAKQLSSTLVVYGDDQVNTAMAKTVGTPVAIATKLILT
ncbi:MAG: saccharopine dehydrogenase NADP-binding domain-containing protein, partial [Bacteroidales bacterium]|nr:saccharopine dehydrogenase NADP-binding domain-containing protein [Bacteroidales bacterium]